MSTTDPDPATLLGPTDIARRKMWNRGYAAGRTELRNAT